MSKEIEELLPFYVNETLHDAERLQVEEALKGSAELQEEVALLKRLRAEMQGVSLETSPGELGLKRLQQTLRSEQTQVIAPPTSANDNIMGWGWKAAAVAACMLLAIQTFVFAPNWSGDDADLTAAGGGTISVPHGVLYSVTFSPNAKEEDMRALLLSVGARIIDGPSAIGVYRLSASGKSDEILKKFQARRNLIDSIQLDSKPKPKQ